MEHDESFFGFGEQYSQVDKKMQEVDVFITDPLSVGSPRTYVSLPFISAPKDMGFTSIPISEANFLWGIAPIEV